MLLIILSWIYILFTSINFGFSFDKMMRLKTRDFSIMAILGLFAVMVLASGWAIFGRINIEFHCFLLAGNGLIFRNYRKEIISKYIGFAADFKQLILPLQIMLTVISLLIVAQCATAPYVLDNESYYLQTIRWLNEYGFVNGLANLHIFLGQNSGWHILQSAFSFSFLYQNFNDLSGFCLLLGTVFSIQKLHLYFSNGNINFLIIGLFPLANVFFFRFISAPSPDIAVYVLTFALFFYFIESFVSIEIADFNLICILLFFLLYVKVMSIGLLLLPLFLLLKHSKKLLPKLLPIGLIGVLVLSLAVVKNSIITGYPLFPTSHFRLPFDFAVPENVVRYYFSENRLYSFFLTSREFHSMTMLQIAMKWLFASKINGFMNGVSILMLLLIPIFIHRYFNSKAYWILYGTIVLEFLILLSTSPVFRFFIHFTLFFGFFIFAVWFNKRKFILESYIMSTLLIIVVLFIPINFKALTKNERISKNSAFTYSMLVFPHQNSKSVTTYQHFEKGNLKYNSPTENSFFWGCGNGALPCVSKHQLEFFEQRLLVYPQLRTTDIKDGFYAKYKFPDASE